MAVNKQYKDRLFRLIFSEKEPLLQLYNAINSEQEPIPLDAEVVINTIDDAIFMGMKNDISFIVNGDMCLFEQQSTYNPNMPFRCFLYISQLYAKMYSGHREVYKSQLFKLPFPQCVVFYNGTEYQPERKLLRLSDAFKKENQFPCMELEVLCFNINKGFNQHLMASCPELNGYSIFISKVRTYMNQMQQHDAIDKAIDDCIKEGYLVNILATRREEVVMSILSEYNEKLHMDVVFEEGKEEGVQEGVQKGIQEGKLEMIRNLLAADIPIDSVAKFASLSVSEIEELLKRNCNKE